MSGVEDALQVDLVLDEETLLLQEQERRLSSWCPWPSPNLGVYVEGASTRGAELSLERNGALLTARVSVPALATWNDWELGVHLVCALLSCCDERGSAQVEGLGRFAVKGMTQTFLDSEDYYLAESEAGWAAVGRAIDAGRQVRIGGPAGFATGIGVSLPPGSFVWSICVLANGRCKIHCRLHASRETATIWNQFELKIVSF